MSKSGQFVVAEIIIERIMTDDGGDTVWCEAKDEAGEPLALVTALGMLRMTEDTLIRMDMGEMPEEYVEDDDEDDEEIIEEEDDDE